MSRQDDVRAVSDKFYSGLSRMDVAALPEIWSHSDDVTTMHPIERGSSTARWADAHLKEAPGMSGGIRGPLNALASACSPASEEIFNR